MPRARIAWLVALVVVAATATIVFATAGGAAAPASTLTIEKVVKGTDASDTTFTVHVECSETGGHTVNFGSNGDPDPSGSNVLSVDPADECTVTEAHDGGATSTSFACSSDPDEVCTADNKVEFTDSDETATITVTNTFEAPTTTTTTTTTPAPTATTAAPPASTNVVRVQPTFTG